jgi:hypothetical protein
MPPSDLDPDHEPEPADEHRVQTLLVSVRDLASSLHRLSAQLERELGPVLAGGAEGEPEPGTEQAADREVRAAERAELERLRAELDQLRAAQEARVVIEQAKGMLMAGRRCSDQQAFDLLVGMSQAEQRKVREIAAEIVASAAPRPPAQGAAARPTPASVRPGLRIDLDDAGHTLSVGPRSRPR